MVFQLQIYIRGLVSYPLSCQKPHKKAHLNPYIVVIRCENHGSEVAAMDFLKKQVKRYIIKSKTARKGAIEINAEVRMKEDNTDFINILSEMNGVNSAVLVSYNGDYMG